MKIKDRKNINMQTQTCKSDRMHTGYIELSVTQNFTLKVSSNRYFEVGNTLI